MSGLAPFGHAWLRATARALTLVLALGARQAAAASEPLAALGDLARTPLAVTGDLIGGVGLVSAALLASAGDALSLLDDNALFRGLASRGVRTLARGVSYGATQSLELLRGEDIERWPEAGATYRDAAAFTGRLDTATSGIGALNLAVRDALLAPPGVLLRAVGAQRAAQTLADSRRDAALRFLGPAPAPQPAEPTRL